MPPKKEANVKKKAKPSTENQLLFMTKEEMKAKEQKYSNQLTELRKCLSFIDDALLEIAALSKKELLESKWQTYLSCDPLPKPYIPANMRLLYSKLKFMEKESVDQNINWLLPINERSILSQDIFRQDLTRKHLKATLKKNIGEEYSNYVNDCVRVLKRIGYFLDDDIEVAKCPVGILTDIVNHKSALQDEIMDFMDCYTYRIISSENSEMNSLDSICAEYFFKAQDFEIHIWCLKNVAIRLTHLREPCLLANFHSMNVQLQIPSAMLEENLVVRAIHMNFDHLSENARSFKQVVPDCATNLNAGILDLHECLVNEWFMQLEMQAKIRNDMTQKRMEYEEKYRQYIQQVEKLKSRKKDDETVTKLPKPPVEPSLIDDDKIPIIYEDFLKEEQKQYEEFCKSVYDPELLNLSEDELNLKQYFILGGIYQLYYVKKPIHNDFDSYNMTWHKNEAKLIIDKNIQITAKPMSLRASRSSKRLTKRMSAHEMDRSLDPELSSPWFIITVVLPDYLCFWGKPIACHFEETTRNIVNYQPVVEKEEPTLKKHKRESKFSASNTINQSLRQSVRESRSFVPAEDNFNLKRKHLANSQTMSRSSFFQESLANSLLNQKKSDYSQRGSMIAVQVSDFLLTEILTTPQTRQLERHILPRIISSCKFPKESQLEDQEISKSKKTRSKGGKLVHHKENEESKKKLTTRKFNFTERQTNPERLYANFSQAEFLNIVANLKAFDLDVGLAEPETFAELLEIVNQIKSNLCSADEKVSHLKPLEQEVITRNKRIRQMLRKRALSTAISTLGSIGSPESRSVRNTKDLVETKMSAELQTNEDNLLSKNVSLALTDTTASEQEQEVETYLHWTTKYIIESEFDNKSCKFVIHTDRLGNLGFAFKRYEHFPFKYWTMEPSADDPQNEVVFTLDTQYVRCILFITAQGIRGHVTEATTTYVRNPRMYLVIDEPTSDFKEFKQLFKDKNLNIFAEPDAIFYIENGYFSEKHLSNELHTYNCMAVHSTQVMFKYSQWNRLARRRDIILKFKQYQDLPDNIVQVQIAPGEAYFVEIEETCSEDLNSIKLNFIPTWRNIDTYSDLHHLIISMYPNASDLRCKNSKLICYVKNLLSEIRPLSFS